MSIGRRRYSRPDPPEPAKIVVDQLEGRVIGYERSDGTFVAAGEPCCADPTQCRRAECWDPWPSPPKPRWWRR